MNNTTSDIKESLSFAELKSICKDGKAYIYPFGPVGIVRMGTSLNSQIAMEASIRKFDGMSQMINFMLYHKGLIIYEIFKYNDSDLTYDLRYFSDRHSNDIRLTRIQYLYNRITDWRKRYKISMELRAAELPLKNYDTDYIL